MSFEAYTIAFCPMASQCPFSRNNLRDCLVDGEDIKAPADDKKYESLMAALQKVISSLLLKMERKKPKNIDDGQLIHCTQLRIEIQEPWSF